jgi:phage terminase large subunit
MGVATAQFPAKLAFLFEPSRYKVLYGGRGGAKSWGKARALLILAAQRRLRVLCVRELQVSIQDSVHKLLAEQIEQLGLSSFYEVQQSTIIGKNGSEFIFSGLRSNATKIKSMEGVDICWVEEAQTVSSASLDILIPTIRKEGSEIWASFNPDLETDPVYTRFVANPPPNAAVVEIGWQDNPWFPDVLREEKDYLYQNDPEAAAHVWGGKTRRNTQANVLRGRYLVESFEPETDWNGPYYGADWGFSVDPTALIRCWVKERVLYIEHEAYGVGVDIDDTPALFDNVPDARKHSIRADNSRPETISHMNRHGYTRLTGCDKGPGSIEDGVEHLRSYERIVIHPRCKHTADEARLWSYKVDKLTGDVLPVLLDKHDHCWDAIRYALEPIIQAGKPKKKTEPERKPKDKWAKQEAKASGWKVA